MGYKKATCNNSPVERQEVAKTFVMVDNDYVTGLTGKSYKSNAYGSFEH